MKYERKFEDMILECVIEFDVNIIYFKEFFLIMEELYFIIHTILFHNFSICVVKKHIMKSLHLDMVTKIIQYNFSFNQYLTNQNF